MELRHLRYFLAVGEASNFTTAAARLRVAQPALSRQIQDLEDEIGVDLLKRSPRGVTLTAEGKLFLEESSVWKETGGKYVTAHLASSAKFLKEHADLLQKFVAAHVELTQWINDHSDEAKKLLDLE